MVVAMLADIAIKSSQFLMNSAKTRGGVVYIAIGSRETVCVQEKFSQVVWWCHDNGS